MENLQQTTQQKTFHNATGKIDYPLTNDYMFRAVLQKNQKVLKGLIAALLHLNSQDIQSADILNPIVLGEFIDDKTFVLDVKVMLDNSAIINLEMQVLKQDFWSNRSLSYLCGIFNNLEKGEDYSQVMPAYHIGIVDFTPFPAYPEFYASNKMMNIKNHYIYNDNFTLNVLDLNQIALATEEDKAFKIDYWAQLFKAKTWEDFKMLAKTDDVFEETCETVYNLNQDRAVRYWCEAREEGERILRTYQNIQKRDKAELAKKNAEIAQKNSLLEQQQNMITEMQSIICEMRSEISELKTQLENTKNS